MKRGVRHGGQRPRGAVGEPRRDSVIASFESKKEHSVVNNDQMRCCKYCITRRMSDLRGLKTPRIRALLELDAIGGKKAQQA